MSKGAILIARNNTEVDYVKQAVFLANRIKHFLNIPVSIITDNSSYLNENYDAEVFDSVIDISNDSNFTYKKYNDGIFSRKSLEFKNTARADVYNLSPYDETLLLDTDFIVSNTDLLECFNQKNNFLIYDTGVELSGHRDLKEFEYISEVGPKFYWATVVFFRKTKENKTFFNLVKHIQENWNHYKTLYQIRQSTFRNDFAFSIAIHIMNGYKQGNFAKPMPGKMFYTTDRDLLVGLDNTKFTFLLEKQTNNGYFPAVIYNNSVHVMNKYSLSRIIDNA
jgi:hypothetical protein